MQLYSIPIHSKRIRNKLKPIKFTNKYSRIVAGNIPRNFFGLCSEVYLMCIGVSLNICPSKASMAVVASRVDENSTSARL